MYLNTNDEQILTFLDWVRRSDKIVFFGGAGVSTESGIPDFRSQNGLYRQKYTYSPETILSGEFFHRNPEEFYKFYREKLLFVNAKPNAAHLKLAELESAGKLLAVVTQNIDGLHTIAGSQNVIELHGSVYRNHCTRCKKKYPIDVVVQSRGIPLCSCGGIVRPDVVLYGEPLDNNASVRALKAISQADMLIVAGTSLSVYPAAGLVSYYRGNRFVLINLDETEYDTRCNLIIRKRVGEVFSKL